VDPISQAALGAVVGQVVGHRRVGPRAAAIGALAGALPDVDVLFSVGGSYFDQLLLHRGITHSLFFAPVVGPALGWAVWRWERRRVAQSPSQLRTWILVVSLALLSHPLLDYLTPYGTQLLLPFSDMRFAIAAMPIIDPVYTILLLCGLYWARRAPARAARVAMATLLTSSAYLGYGWHLNEAAADEARQQLRVAGIENAQVAAFPTVLQIHYRRVVARTPSTDRVGFISMWRPCQIAWGSAPRANQTDVEVFSALPEGRIFTWFTMGWTHYVSAVTNTTHTVRASDLRYGATTNPAASIFSATVRQEANAAGQISAGRSLPDTQSLSLARLITDAYAPVCLSDSGLARKNLSMATSPKGSACLTRKLAFHSREKSRSSDLCIVPITTVATNAPSVANPESFWLSQTSP
jgi:inner membrane protein